MFFGVHDIPGQLRFARTDIGAATAEEVTLFHSLWQGRVRTLLVDYADYPHVIAVQPSGDYRASNTHLHID